MCLGRLRVFESDLWGQSAQIIYDAANVLVCVNIGKISSASMENGDPRGGLGMRATLAPLAPHVKTRRADFGGLALSLRP